MGDWSVEVVFPGDPPTTLQGRASIARSEGGAYLNLRSLFEGKSPPTSISVIGRDDKGEGFTMLYADERGVSRVYQMTLSNDVWTLWREAPGFNQRFTGRFDSE